MQHVPQKRARPNPVRAGFGRKRKSLYFEAVILLLTLCAVCAGRAEEKPAEKEGAVAAPEYLQAASIKGPAFRAPRLQVSDAPDTGWEGPTFLGVDLEQNGRRLEPGERPPRIDLLAPLNITGYWLINGPLPPPASIEAALWSHDGKISRSLVLTAEGQEEKPRPAYGSSCSARYVLNLPELNLFLSGRAHLVVSHLASPPAFKRKTPLQNVPLDIIPSVHGRRVSTKNYASLFGEYQSLSASFRLGCQARLELPIGAPPADKVRAIGVVSAFSYGTLPQGETVCEITVRSGSEAPVTLPLRSGVTTAKGDYDFYATRTLDHKKVAIGEAVDTDYLNEAGAPFMKHKFLGILPLPQGLGDLKTLEFESVGPVVLDVFDVVLITKPAPSARR